jgi:SSS family solute:Na+ symporter
LTAFVLNIIVATVLTVVFNATKLSNGDDETAAVDYVSDAS